MRRLRSLNSRVLTLLAVGALLLPGRAGIADDTALFTAIVPPNVMLMIDNSGSMNNIV